MATTTYQSVITLNVNWLNAPIKRHTVAEWIIKQDPYIKFQRHTQTKSKEMEKDILCKWKWRNKLR